MLALRRPDCPHSVISSGWRWKPGAGRWVVQYSLTNWKFFRMFFCERDWSPRLKSVRWDINSTYSMVTTDMEVKQEASNEVFSICICCIYIQGMHIMYKEPHTYPPKIFHYCSGRTETLNSVPNTTWFPQ